MTTPPFKMSDEIKALWLAALEGLSVTHKRKFLDAMSALLAEVQLHTRQQVFEELRKEWSNTLSTMHLIDPRIIDKNKK